MDLHRSYSISLLSACFGVPLFPEFMATDIVGPMNIGMLIFLLLHILTPLLAFRYLKQLQGEKQ